MCLDGLGVHVRLVVLSSSGDKVSHLDVMGDQFGAEAPHLQSFDELFVFVACSGDGGLVWLEYMARYTIVFLDKIICALDVRRYTAEVAVRPPYAPWCSIG